MTDNGTLTQEGDIATIEFTRRLQASPERVWQALTEADELTSWLAEASTFDGGSAEKCPWTSARAGSSTGR